MTGKQKEGYISLLRVAYHGNNSTASEGQKNWHTAYPSGCMPSEQAKMESLIAEATARTLPWRHSVTCAYSILHGISRERYRRDLHTYYSKRDSGQIGSTFGQISQVNLASAQVSSFTPGSLSLQLPHASVIPIQFCKRMRNFEILRKINV